MFRIEKARLRAAENMRSGLFAEEVPDVVADNRGAHEEPGQQVQVYAGGSTGKTDRKQKRVAGQKKPDQQTGFGKYDPEKARNSQRAAEQNPRQFQKTLGVIQR